MLHIDLADQYRRGSSLIHRLDPRIKVLCTLLFILVATLLPAGKWLALAVLWVATMVVAYASGLGVGFALRRSLVALPFALAAITLPFTIQGETLARLGPLSISAEGTIRFASILVKSWLSVQMAILLTATSAFHDLLWGLRELRVPRPLVSIVSFMYRYLFVLADEALRLMRARQARSGSPETGSAGPRRGGPSVVWHGKVAGGMVGNLALRAFERSERIYDAMVARGFRGEIRALAPPRLTDLDRGAMVVWVTLLAMAVLVGIVF